MALSGIIGVIIALIIIGVLVWGARELIAVIPMDPWIKQLINVLVIVLLVLAVVFYVVVPLLSTIGGQIHVPALR
jgi:hypothetical protein